MLSSRGGGEGKIQLNETKIQLILSYLADEAMSGSTEGCLKLSNCGFIFELLLPQPVLQQDFTMLQDFTLLTKEGLRSNNASIF